MNNALVCHKNFTGLNAIFCFFWIHVVKSNYTLGTENYHWVKVLNRYSS